MAERKDRAEVHEEIKLKYENPIYGLNPEERGALVDHELLDIDIKTVLGGGQIIEDIGTRIKEMKENKHLESALKKKQLAEAV